MTPALLLAASVLFAAPAPQPPLPDASTVVLKKGEVRRIPAPGLARLALSGPEVVDARPRGTEIELRGVRDGRTTLLLWFADGERRSYLLQVGDPKAEASPRPDSVRGAPGVELFRDVDPLDCTGEATGPRAAALVKQADDLEQVKEYAQAVETLRLALGMQPGAAHLHLKLGSLYAKMGKKEPSAEAYGTFALACPDHPQAPKARELSRKPGAASR